MTGCVTIDMARDNRVLARALRARQREKFFASFF
jgi:hypothetical protein